MDTSLRFAEPRDLEAIVDLISALAAFEQLSHQVRVTPAQLGRHLFGERPTIECVVAEQDAKLVGFALFFTNFSTFLGQPGLYLEDLFVLPEQRGSGIGKRLLMFLAKLAVKRDYGRFEWSVLDWNASAIAFYEKMGATVMPDWRVCRVTGGDLVALASRSDIVE